MKWDFKPQEILKLEQNDGVAFLASKSFLCQLNLFQNSFGLLSRRFGREPSNGTSNHNWGKILKLEMTAQLNPRIKFHFVLSLLSFKS